MYKLLMDSLSINIAVYSPTEDGNDFVFVDLNKTAEDTESLSKEELQGKRFTEVFPGVQSSGLLEVLQRVYKTGVSEIYESPDLHKDEKKQTRRKNEVKRLSNGNIIAMYEDCTFHKDTKAQLESELASLGKIVDHSLNEIYIFDPDTLRISYVNKGASENLGYRYQELIQMTPVDIKPAYTEERFRTVLKPLLDGRKKQLVFEAFHLRKDKSRYIIEVRLQLTKNSGKEQIVVIGNDISKRKVSEKALKKNIQRLEETERIAHFGGWEWDIQKDIVLWSDEVYRIFKEEPQSFTCTNELFLSYLPKEDQSKIKAAVKKAKKSRTKYEIEHKIFLKDGTTKHVKSIGEFIYNKDGKAVKLAGGILDITDYIRLKDALNEQEEAYSQLFYQSQDGMMLNDVDGRILDHNQAILDLLKLHSVDDFLNKQPFEFSPEVQPDGKPSSQRQAEKLEKVSHGVPQRFEWQIRQSDGRLSWVEISLTPIVIGGRPRVHSVWRDISNRKLMQAEIAEFNEELTAEIALAIKKNEEQSQYMLHQSRLAQMGEMISMIAHQWRQPLASISAISGTLNIDVLMDEYKKDFFEDRLNAISDLALHLSSTIDDFRGFFKDEKEMTLVDWKDMTESSLAIIEPTFTDKHIRIHKEYTDSTKVLTHQNEVRQVILNIVKNAEDALSENKVDLPEIWIKSYQDQTHSHLSIEDNAGGIPEDIRDKIFDPYFSTKDAKEGTGLGLYMSKMIIEDNCQGRLKLKEGSKGAVFTLSLPLRTKEKSS